MPKKLVISMHMEINIVGDDEKEDVTVARCKFCGWSKPYKSEKSAKRGLASHLPYCPEKEKTEREANNVILSWMNDLVGGEQD